MMQQAIENKSPLPTTDVLPMPYVGVFHPEDEAQKQVDLLQAALATREQIKPPLTHSFTPGLYIREIVMPASALIISKIHKTEHPYVILRGKVSVWIDGVGVQTITGPHIGITKPGTRRILYIHEECHWATFHPTNETDVEKIEDQIILKRDLNVDAADVASVCEQLFQQSNAQPLSE